MPLIVGTAQLGSDYGIANLQGKPDTDTGLRILYAADECGCRWLDTAPGYGQSEEIIGAYFQKNSESPMQVITKIPSMAGIDSETKVAEFIQLSFQRSVRRIGRNRIKGLLLHDENDFGHFGGLIWREFAKLQAEHALVYMGISTYHPNYAAKIAGDGFFNAVQMPGNAFDQRYTRLIEENRLSDSTTVFIRSIYLQGLFFADPERISRRIPEALGFVGQFHNLVRQYSLSVREASLGFIKFFLRPGDFVVIGAEEIGQVKQNFVMWEDCHPPKDFIRQCRDHFDSLPENIINPSKWKLQ